MVGQRDVYCAAKYVLEHRLMAYVEVQMQSTVLRPLVRRW